MRPPSPPDWRRRLVITAIVGSSVLYCLGTGAYALRQSLVPGGQATVPVTASATQTPSTTPQGFEPTPTQASLVLPTLPPATLAPQPTEAPATPATSPTAVPTEPPTATVSPTPETPTLEPTATETPPPTETPTETPDHGRDKPTATPSPAPD